MRFLSHSLGLKNLVLLDSYKFAEPSGGILDVIQTAGYDSLEVSGGLGQSLSVGVPRSELPILIN